MEPVQVNRSVLEIMNMNREQRRRIAKMNGLKNIPSIVNVQVIKATPDMLKKVEENNTPSEKNEVIV